MGQGVKNVFVDTNIIIDLLATGGRLVHLPLRFSIWLQKNKVNRHRAIAPSGVTSLVRL